MKNRILIIAAHPDDEILGCGGTVSRLVKEGSEISVIILGQGMPSRAQVKEGEEENGYPALLKEQSRQANRIIGVKDLYFYDLPDNQFDTVPLLVIVKIIEDLKKKLQPDIIFTHFSGDLNVDHRITYQAVLTAARPVPNESVKEIYSFEIISSTEWNFPTSFQPDLFFDIEDTIGLKLEALKKYNEELNRFPHPRSLEGVELNARSWGMKTGIKYAEAFKVVRILRRLSSL